MEPDHTQPMLSSNSCIKRLVKECCPTAFLSVISGSNLASSQPRHQSLRLFSLEILKKNTSSVSILVIWWNSEPVLWNKLEDEATAAEGIFAFHTLKHYNSYNVMACTYGLLKATFSDSDIAKKFYCGKTKTEASLNSFTRDVVRQLDESLDRDKLQSTIKFLLDKNVSTDDVKCFYQFCNLKKYVNQHGDEFANLQAHQKWTKYFESSNIVCHSELLKIA
ncbi:hypothetical protein ANN_14946 [Periplaneta americana]|uniref:Uncharacterized protein n=1 Tax=Periplaneta americana TaxID=6978 RepID=A0ABQ8SZ42_PERAM|nr:hypothetical protein ANN_14946 [Periplaneta americana]